jgi:hypothetical protein
MLAGLVLTCVFIGLNGVASAQFKTTKSAAHYQDSPKGQQRCADCKYFQPPDRCKRVSGEIKPSGWCRFFDAEG